MVVGLIEELVHATYDRHENGARLLLALDELANVAPLPRLAGIVSEGGGQRHYVDLVGKGPGTLGRAEDCR